MEDFRALASGTSDFDLRIMPGDSRALASAERERIFNGSDLIAYCSLPYDEAMKILKNAVGANEASFRYEPKYGGDFQREHEQYLVRYCGGLPLFVHRFPLASKPFYMKQCTADPEKVDCFDLLTLDAGEICGGSLREDDYDRLARRLEAAELRDSLNWYLELRKFGHAGHGGFGVGFERLLQLFLGIKNIRDTVLFPRRYQDLPG